MLPNTVERVPLNTSEEINQRIARETNRRENVVTKQVATVAGRIEETVQAGVAGAERVVKTLA